MNVFICSPYSGDIAANETKALQYCRFAVSKGCLPIAPHCYFPQFMDESNPTERELGIAFGIRLLGGCEQLWLFGTKITDGMRKEVNAAKNQGIIIRQFNENMEEIHAIK